MDFKSVTIGHFMSFKNAERFFGGPGLTLIEGENGAGKSSVWDAVSWCLFGLTVRGLGGDDIIHRLYKKNCMVAVKLFSGANTYTITRYRKHDKFQSRLRIVVNRNGAGDEDIEKSTVADTQRWLCDELGIDFELFRCTVLFAQEERFNFVSETDKKQKEILGKVRKVDFTSALANVRQAMKDHNSERANVDQKLVVLKSHASDGGIIELKAEAEAWEADRKARSKECKARIKTTETAIAELPEAVDLAKFTEVKAKINAAISNRQGTRRSAQQRKSDIQQRQGYATGRFNDLKKLKDECPTCDQPIDSVALGAKCEELRLQRIALVSEAAAVEKTLEKIDGEINDLQEKLANLNEKEADQRVAAEKMKSLRNRLGELEAERAEIADEENPVTVKIAEAIDKQERIKAKIVELNAQLEALDEKLPYLQFWEQGYGDKGIKSFLFDTVCGALTAKANHYLNILSNGNVTVSFDTQSTLKSGETRERFECSVVVDGEAVPYVAYSGGEKTRISLAVDMALCDLMNDSHGSSFNIVVFDEQDMWLDSEGREAYLRLLRERAKHQRVFVVSHDGELKAKFDSTWTVIKEGRISRFAA